MSKYVKSITAHELAALLLAAPDLPVYRHTDGDIGCELPEILPLSAVEVMEAVDIYGDPMGPVVMVEPSLIPENVPSVAQSHDPKA